MATSDNGLAITSDARGVVTVSLNRPERGNALGLQMIEGLQGQLDAMTGDDAARVLVLRGNGKHFCAGVDLTERGGNLAGLLDAVERFPKPVVAVIHGGCIGAGVALAGCCDIVVAGENAFFSFPELRLGMVPGNIMPHFVRAVGVRAFRRYGLTGERMPARQAWAMGLVQELAENVETADLKLAEILDGLFHSGPGAIGHFKERLRTYDALPAAPRLEGESEARAAEIAEGKAAFKEKRKPAWYRPA